MSKQLRKKTKVAPTQDDAVPAQAQLRPVQGRTLRELAYAELRRAVLTGQFAPGESFTIADLSAQLGIGAMPTREAVQQLASQGAFELLPNRSVRVPSVTLAELTSLFEARLLLETFATGRAAVLMTKEESLRVAANLEVLANLLRKRVAADCLEANYEFHFSIYRASRSPYVVELIEQLWLRMSPLHVKVLRAAKGEQDDFLSAMPKHHTLVAAIAARDSAKAQATLSGMLGQSLEWHSRQFDVP